jgi:hypothetical protein
VPAFDVSPERTLTAQSPHQGPIWLIYTHQLFSPELVVCYNRAFLGQIPPRCKSSCSRLASTRLLGGVLVSRFPFICETVMIVSEAKKNDIPKLRPRNKYVPARAFALATCICSEDKLFSNVGARNACSCESILRPDNDGRALVIHFIA